MKTTITRALSDRQVKEDDVPAFINKELVPLMREFRNAHNEETVEGSVLITEHTGVFSTIWASDPMPTNSTWHVTTRITALSTAGAAQQCAYERSAYFANVGGVVSQVGGTALLSTFESAAAADVQFTVVGQAVELQVKDDGASTFAWKALVRILPSDEL